MWRWLLALLVVISVGLLLCRRNIDDTADMALKRQLGYLDAKDLERAWVDLHPVQQAFVPKDLYIRCGREQLRSVRLQNISVLSSRDDEAEIPGTGVTAKATLVTAQYTFVSGTFSQRATETFPEFQIDGRWRWTVRDPEPFRQGRCPQ